MPLVLSLYQGQDFFVSDDRVVVSSIKDETEFELYVQKSDTRFTISASESTEIMPDVFVSAGDHQQSTLARIAIDAPQSILILRGDRYRDKERVKG